MRFMLLMIPGGYETAAPGTMPPVEAVEKMMRFNEQLKEAGVLVTLDGLHPPSAGARVSFRDGRPVVTDGPFAEGKEHIGGFLIVRAPDLDAALAWAQKLARAVTLPIEVRPFQGDR